MVARVKASEREREGLEGAKAAAEAYLAKDRECTATHAAIYQLFLRDGQVPYPAEPPHLPPLHARLQTGMQASTSHLLCITVGVRLWSCSAASP